MAWNRNDLWEAPAYLPYVQPPLAAETIAHAEQTLGFKLPDAYLALLREHNGGGVRYTLPDTTHSMIWGIGPFFPNILEVHGALDPALAELGEWIPRDVERLIPFDGDGHWFLCLDYRDARAAPGVAYVDLEFEEDRKVSDTFEQFLGQLQLDLPQRGFGLRGVSLDEAAETIGAALNLRFGAAEDTGMGYPVRRCRLEAMSGDEWVWISLNAVPRGFAHENHERYAELKPAMAGTALRYPEFPGADVLVDSTAGIADLVREACVNAALSLVVLRL